jgi:hypothetical protein
MLATVPGVKSRHEPKPNFADVSWDAQADIETAKQFWLEHKLPAIEQGDSPVYVETSHQFVYFAEALLELDIFADIIVLTRPHREVALSHWRRHAVPGRTPLGKTYLSRPDIPGKVALDNWQSFDDYQLAYWHTLEVEVHANELAAKFRKRGSTVYWRALDDITNEDGFKHLCEQMNLPAPDEQMYRQRAGRKINANPGHVSQLGPIGDLDALEAEVRGDPVGNSDGRPSVHIFILTMGTIREGLSQWRVGWLNDKRYRVRVEGISDYPVDATRNQAVLKFLRGGADYLLMVDEDTIPTRNVLDLVANDLDIVAFPAPMWKPGKVRDYPIHMNIELVGTSGEGGLVLEQYDELMEVSAAGAGALLISRKVLEHPDMRAPFKTDFTADGTREEGEDITFIRRARSAGFRAWAAMNYRCSHYKAVDLLLVDMIYQNILARAKRGEVE